VLYLLSIGKIRENKLITPFAENIMAQTRNSSTTQFADLPDEVLQLILQGLSTNDLLRLSRTCQILRTNALAVLCRNPVFQSTLLTPLLRAGITIADKSDPATCNDLLSALATIAQQPAANIELRMLALMTIIRIEIAAAKKDREHKTTYFDSALQQLLLIGQNNHLLLTVLLHKISQQLGLPDKPNFPLTADYILQDTTGRNSTIAPYLRTEEQQKLAIKIQDLFASGTEDNIVKALYICRTMLPYFDRTQQAAITEKFCSYMTDPEIFSVAQQVCGAMWPHLTAQQKDSLLKTTLSRITDPLAVGTQVSALHTCAEIASQLTPAQYQLAITAIQPLWQNDNMQIRCAALLAGGALCAQPSANIISRNEIIRLAFIGLQDDNENIKLAALDTCQKLYTTLNDEQHSRLRMAILAMLKNPLTQQAAAQASIALWPQLEDNEKQQIWASTGAVTAGIFAKLHAAITNSSLTSVSIFSILSNMPTGYGALPPPPPFPPPTYKPGS